MRSPRHRAGSPGLGLAELRRWPRGRWMVAAVAAAVAAVVTGVPTDLIDTPLFGRSIAVETWAYPVWIVSSILAGLLAATELRPGRPLAGGGVLALVAVGCPVCNKPALLVLGAGGAVTWLGPLQPVLGAAAIVVLGAAFVLRLRAQASCSAPPSALGESR